MCDTLFFLREKGYEQAAAPSSLRPWLPILIPRLQLIKKDDLRHKIYQWIYLYYQLKEGPNGRIWEEMGSFTPSLKTNS